MNRTTPWKKTPADARIDLHLHSSASDGTLSPTALVHRARELGLHTIALTDHDTVAGLDEARAACRATSLEFIPGVELSIGWQNTEIHLLGYGLDARGKRFLDTLDRLAAEREERMHKMIQRLNDMGIGADFEAVQSLSGGHILSRLHLATHLVEKKLVKSIEEAFSKYIGNGRPAYVRRRRLTLKEAIDLLGEVGGIAVLAHPGLTRRDDLIEYLVRLGIRGIEVFYPGHSAGDVARYRKICTKYDLVAVGGSDFHGERKPGLLPGASLTPPQELDRLHRMI